MELSKEMKIWVKAQENRRKSCLDCVKHYKSQILLLKRAIELEKQQAEINLQTTNKALALWKNAK